MTKNEAAVIMAYTGATMLVGEDTDIFYAYVSSKMCKPIWSHELPKYKEEIQKRTKKDFIEICKNLTESDRPVEKTAWEDSTAYKLEFSRDGECMRVPVEAITCRRCLATFIPDGGVNKKEKYRFCPFCGRKSVNAEEEKKNDME